MTERENRLKTDEQTQSGPFGAGAIAGQIIRTTTTTVKSALGTLADQTVKLSVQKSEAVPAKTRPLTSSADTLNIQERAQNSEEAGTKGQARLDSKNNDKHTGSLSLAGDLSLRAGASITLSGFGNADGKWLIISARHSFTRSNGLTTELNIARGIKGKTNRTSTDRARTLTVFKADNTTEQVRTGKRNAV
ncbi:hypothetical protein CYG68_03780 [Morganella morganii]|uniref:Uncharacterized protein n=1 Tax=Morganella morganii TaxID=582 RepID=A0A8I0PUB9_MORMO|nr:hypothetical protein [Morganella morganii]MBE8611535.1 hypothetical protein [Morganella morganii]